MNGDEYRVFPDRREDLRNVTAAHRACAMSARESPDEVIQRLHRIDWRHPALCVFRARGEDRWSQVLLGLPPRSELGEIA
jgi:hypothetical protein